MCITFSHTCFFIFPSLLFCVALRLVCPNKSTLQRGGVEKSYNGGAVWLWGGGQIGCGMTSFVLQTLRQQEATLTGRWEMRDGKSIIVYEWQAREGSETFVGKQILHGKLRVDCFVKGTVTKRSSGKYVIKWRCAMRNTEKSGFAVQCMGTLDAGMTQLSEGQYFNCDGTECLGTFTGVRQAAVKVKKKKGSKLKVPHFCGVNSAGLCRMSRIFLYCVSYMWNCVRK